MEFMLLEHSEYSSKVSTGPWLVRETGYSFPLMLSFLPFHNHFHTSTTAFLSESCILLLPLFPYIIKNNLERSYRERHWRF